MRWISCAPNNTSLRPRVVLASDVSFCQVRVDMADATDATDAKHCCSSWRLCVRRRRWAVQTHVLVSQTNTTMLHCVVGHHVGLRTFRQHCGSLALLTLSVALSSRVLTLCDISNGTLVTLLAGLVLTIFRRVGAFISSPDTVTTKFGMQFGRSQK